MKNKMCNIQLSYNQKMNMHSLEITIFVLFIRCGDTIDSTVCVTCTYYCVPVVCGVLRTTCSTRVLPNTCTVNLRYITCTCTAVNLKVHLPDYVHVYVLNKV